MKKTLRAVSAGKYCSDQPLQIWFATELGHVLVRTGWRQSTAALEKSPAPHRTREVALSYRRWGLRPLASERKLAAGERVIGKFVKFVNHGAGG